MPRKKPSKYSVGDLFVIVYVNKIGVVTRVKSDKYKRYSYEIYWTYKDGDNEIAVVDEKTIDLWFSKTEGRAKDNLNQYHKVPV
jgi:hypothetical protein